MPDDRQPTAEELDALVDAFRRDPARVFVDLGRAFIALGRPREAIDVAAQGLRSDPANFDGRVMVAYAFAQLHQWKEAQAELLKVVKADRNHGAGFRLLGEVLMRRADYERALPVLQHAQNLAPADPSILSLLKRARAGQPLDPPPPVPTPVQVPSGRRAPRREPDPHPLDDVPTRVAADVMSSMAAEADDGVLGRVELERREIRGEGPRAPVDRGARRVDDRGRDREERRPVEVHRPPPVEDPFAPLGSPPPSSSSPPAHPTARPRMLPLEKPKDAAQASLRRSAAVGEDYLNNLLVGGLLDIPKIRVADANYDARPDRRWGRSIARMFVYLFVLLFVGIGGAGTWYWYSEKVRAEDVARLLAAATRDIEHGDHEALLVADKAARTAIERDRSNAYAVAVLAEITGLETLLYRELNPADVDKAISLAADEIDQPGEVGYRELVVARAAVALAQLSAEDEGSEGRLADVTKELETWLAGHADDSLVHWLHGEARLAAGARTAAEAAFTRAHQGGKGSALGTIALADIHLDSARYVEAQALYDSALERAPKHPLAYIGRSLARSERSTELEDAMGDLSVGVARPVGPRVEAYKRLALATAHLGLEDFVPSKTELEQAVGVIEPRFLARVGLLRVARGDLAGAAAARAAIRWYASAPEPDPLVGLLDAELLLARGLPWAAAELIGNGQGLRAARLRGRAMFDQGKGAEAAKELAAALAIAATDLETQAWAEASRLIGGAADERRRADEALDSIGRKAKSKVARLAHGLALAAIGRTPDARERLELSLADLSDEYPNPLAYRGHVALGELAAAEGKSADAVAQAERALELNRGYLPAHDLLGRLLVDSAPERARPHLTEVVTAEVASAPAEVAFARLVAAEDPKAAADAARRAKKKGASVVALQVLFPLLPPELFAELGVPPPKGAR